MLSLARDASFGFRDARIPLLQSYLLQTERLAKSTSRQNQQTRYDVAKSIHVLQLPALFPAGHPAPNIYGPDLFGKQRLTLRCPKELSDSANSPLLAYAAQCKMSYEVVTAFVAPKKSQEI